MHAWQYNSSALGNSTKGFGCPCPMLIIVQTQTMLMAGFKCGCPGDIVAVVCLCQPGSTTLLSFQAVALSVSEAGEHPLAEVHVQSCAQALVREQHSTTPQHLLPCRPLSHTRLVLLLLLCACCPALQVFLTWPNSGMLHPAWQLLQA